MSQMFFFDLVHLQRDFKKSLSLWLLEPTTSVMMTYHQAAQISVCVCDSEVSAVCIYVFIVLHQFRQMPIST